MDEFRDILPSSTPPPEDLIWHCKVHGDLEPVQLVKGGKWFVRRCKCFWEGVSTQEQLQTYIHANQVRNTYTWLGARFDDSEMSERTFSTFDKTRQYEAFTAAQEFASLPHGSLILHGDYGTGKTHLLAAICNEVAFRQTWCLFTTASKFFRALEARIGEKHEYYSLVDQAKRAPVLAIDDIDKAKPSEFRQEIWFDIVDTRVNKRLPIALSTNRLAELPGIIGGAVSDRLTISQVEVRMVGKSYRREL